MVAVYTYVKEGLAARLMKMMLFSIYFSYFSKVSNCQIAMQATVMLTNDCDSHS